uniref:Uncharacterized protein n=1 Tax=Vitis vinifera TaxID=29760 RepID=A5B7M4_VITVI|nr:hypothetical protein VITISV_037553 [Vitis vinifera]
MLVASLSAKFRMPDIERYTGIGCPRIHLRLYSTVMRVHGLDESQVITLFPLSLSGVAQHVSMRELEALRQRSDESVSSFNSRWCRKIVEIIDRPLEMDQIQIVLRSLQPKIARHVVGVSFTNFGSLVLALYDVEDGISKVCRETYNILSQAQSLAELRSFCFEDIEIVFTVGLVPKTTSVQTTIVVSLTFPHYNAQMLFVLISDVEKVRTPFVDDARIPDIQYVIRGGRVVVTVQSMGDVFISSELVLQTSHSDDDLYLTEFTFNEMQTLEMEDFYRDFMAMSFDRYGSTVVLDMMSMSYLPGMGLGRRQHGPNEFMAIPYHDVPFGLGFIPIEADYRYMARLHKERPQMPSDGIIGGLNTIQEAELQRLVHQLQLSNGASGTSTSALVASSSPDRMSLMTLYFPNEIDEHRIFVEIGDIIDGAVPHDEYIDEMIAMSMSQIEEIVQPELASPFDLFGVSTIEIVEEIQTTPALEFADDVTAIANLLDGPIGPVEGASDFVDPPLSFDVLSGFVSRSDDVHGSLFMDLSIFEFLHVSYDIVLSTPFSPTSQIFDIDDEIAQYDSDDDSSIVSDPDPID